MRLQEWVADAEGFFTAEGLDYELLPTLHLIGAPSVSSSETLPPEWRRGAFETFVQGRPCDISSACHWVTNVAAVGGNGRMWGQAYSVCPSAVFVPPESPSGGPRTWPAWRSPSATTRAATSPRSRRSRRCCPPTRSSCASPARPSSGWPRCWSARCRPRATFGLAYYVLEQQGFRKVLDTTFMMGFQVTSDASQDDLERYFRALGHAQQAIDLEPERYKHYFLRELPEQYHALFDPRLAGTGERVVFQPYTQEIFERTYRWVIERGLFGADEVGTAPYAQAIVV